MLEPAIVPQADISRAARLFLWLCSLFCFGFLVWAAFCPLDIVSEAQGEVVPRTKVKRIQHLEGGIIRQLHVKEGDRVKADQPLITLEATTSDSNVEEITVHLNSLRVEITRLEAESRFLAQGREALLRVTAIGEGPSEHDPVYPPDLVQNAKDLVDKSLELFRTRIRRLQNDLSGQKEKIKQREHDIVEISARVRNMRKNLAHLREQIAISQSLLDDQLTTKYKHLEFLKEETTLKSRIEEDTQAAGRADSALKAAREALDQAENAFKEEVQKDLKKAQDEFMEYNQRMRKFHDSLSRTVIRAPEEGVVKTMYIVNEGEVVKPGITVMDIVPVGDRMVIEAHLPIGDIGYVQAGQSAAVRIASRDARRYGNLEGKVVHVSPDAIMLATGGTFYRVQVETEKDYFERKNERYQLFPGMRVTVGIRTGQRTVLEYLLYPYFEALTEGMGER